MFALLACGCGTPPRGISDATSPKMPLPPPPLPRVRTLTATDREQSATVIDNAIRETLRKPSGPITDIDRQRITELYLIGRDITDLSSLAALQRLKVLNLRGNRVADLRPLARLAHLEKLGLDGNQVVDLTPLRGLKRLKVLDLYNNSSLSSFQIHSLRQALPGCRVLVAAD